MITIAVEFTPEDEAVAKKAFREFVRLATYWGDPVRITTGGNLIIDFAPREENDTIE